MDETRVRSRVETFNQYFKSTKLTHVFDKLASDLSVSLDSDYLIHFKFYPEEQ